MQTKPTIASVISIEHEELSFTCCGLDGSVMSQRVPSDVARYITVLDLRLVGSINRFASVKLIFLFVGSERHQTRRRLAVFRACARLVVPLVSDAM